MSEEKGTTAGDCPVPGEDETLSDKSPAPSVDEQNPGEVSPAVVGESPGEGSPEDGSSGAEEEEEEEEEEETDQTSPEEQLLALGKKYLAAGDAASAVESFQEACSILAEEYGQVSKELAEPYYLYGRALLDLAREKSAMFGKGIPSSEGRGSSEAGPSGANASESGPSRADTSSAGASNGSCSNVEAQSSQGVDGSQEGGEEEESDLQLSWEILELARVICQRESDNEYKLKLSDVNLALGEVGLESDQYQQAVQDLQSSLRLREFALEPTDRRIAEVHFSLGLAYTLAREVDQAIEAYKSSKALLVRRKEELEQKVAEDEELQREIKELEELIPDIDSKISDVEDLKKVLQERENLINEPEESTGFDQPNKEFDTSGSTVVPVTDISHLVRKRNITGTDTNPTKRPCTENGDSIATSAQPSEQ